MIYAVASRFGHGMDEQDPGAVRRTQSTCIGREISSGSSAGDRSSYRRGIGEGFECVVQLTETLEAKQQPAEDPRVLATLLTRKRDKPRPEEAVAKAHRR
jgi:hypothetical protein